MRRLDRRRLVLPIATSFASLTAATVVVALLQDVAGVPNASVVYLAAVVTTAFVAGTIGAIASATAAFLLYDFLFVQPVLQFTVSDPGEWLNLVLLLFTGIVVGQLAALQRSRADQAREREREAIALFRVSRELATRSSTQDVLPTITRTLVAETAMTRVWVALGPDDAQERVVADSSNEGRAAVPGLYQVLQRLPEDVPARWARVHQPSPGRGRSAASLEAYRVRIEAGGRVLGSIWALRDRADREPDGTETRLLSAAADQVGQAVTLDALATASQAAEIARQSDAIKSALLQSVSHDLRTPLATIRAAAGTLRPGSHLDEEGRRESADAIDREVEYLNRLVTNMLDLSRIEGGALKADRDVFELEDLVGRTLERFGPRLAGRPVDVALEAPPVDADPVFLDSAVTNTLENALKYTPAGTRIRVTATPMPDEPVVRLTVEDAGPGVPPAALPLLFEKFYRVPGSAGGSRSGTGVGLAVVKGLVEATGGHVAARRSELGGLALDMDLPRAALAAGDAAGAAQATRAGDVAGSPAAAGAPSATPGAVAAPG
jgi:two-component system, OmpR family, sensor histidine kinase KdpD